MCFAYTIESQWKTVLNTLKCIKATDVIKLPQKKTQSIEKEKNINFTIPKVYTII